jgi:hypothetical protein
MNNETQPVTELLESLGSSSEAVAARHRDYLTTEQVMDWLGVSRQWLADHRTRVQPIIPHIKLGREILYPKHRVAELLASLTETRPSWERKAA